MSKKESNLGRYPRIIKNPEVANRKRIDYGPPILGVTWNPIDRESLERALKAGSNEDYSPVVLESKNSPLQRFSGLIHKYVYLVFKRN